MGTATAATSVKRVTLPRYEVTYTKVADALGHAKMIMANQVVSLTQSFAEQKGQEVVLDLRVDGMAATVTLLFRIIQKVEDETYLEWWPRRQTDPDLLEMWAGWLEETLEQAQGLCAFSLPPTQILDMFDRCRRALEANPFVALGIHWTATEEQVNRAYSESMARLLTYKNAPGSGKRALEMLEKAKDGLNAARQKLSSIEKRREQRFRFVPQNQVDQARELAKSKMGAAQLRGRQKEFHQLRAELYELGA